MKRIDLVQHQGRDVQRCQTTAMADDREKLLRRQLSRDASSDEK